jgi:hypothetical protein
MILIFLHNATPNFHHKTHTAAAAAVSLKITLLLLLHTLAHTHTERESASQITLQHYYGPNLAKLLVHARLNLHFGLTMCSAGGRRGVGFTTLFLHGT